MEQFFKKGLAASTQKTYRAAQVRYLDFCKRGQFQPLPTSESLLCRFVSYLAKDGLKHRSIKCYLSALRFLHIREGLPDPFITTMNRLHYTLRGIKRQQGENMTGTRERLPITPRILQAIKRSWDSRATDPDIVMLWAACCLGFFGFLRSAEMCSPSDNGFDPSAHLSINDIAVDDATTPSMLRVTIKQSKTDPFRQGINLFIGKTASALCPVKAMLNYLKVRGSDAGPLFRFNNGQLLTRDRLVLHLRGVLTRVGIDPKKYCSHSFRIGAATTAASRGVEDSVIKTLGRWKSQAYQEYVKIPREQLAGYSSLLSSPRTQESG